MLSSFLNDTINWRAQMATQDLVNLWKQKRRLIGDTPFSARWT